MRRVGDLLYLFAMACAVAAIAVIGLDALPACVHAQTSNWPLTWTAAGDDSSTGTAAALMVFYSATTPDTTGETAWLNAGGLTSQTPAGIAAWINQAKYVAGPTPLPGGSAQTFTIQDSFLGGVKYWVMIRTCDDALACARSNYAIRTVALVDTSPPRCVRDLRTGP